MNSAEIHLNLRRTIAAVDPRIYGGFLEHLGRAVYQGAYQPGHPSADTEGFRQDVMGALREIGFSCMRYPGGNFVSNYDWKDGIGPKSARPVRRDYAWKSIETNQFGTDEFIAWCRKVGTDPMIAVNLGTGSPKEAAEWVEYCNLPSGSAWSDRRPASEPYGVKIWCLGNEMDGDWQAGQRPAADYASTALQASRLMKGMDPTIETVVAGSSGRWMSTYMEWDREVLETTWGSVDYISAHRYTNKRDLSDWDYQAEGMEIDRVITDYRHLIGYVRAKKKDERKVGLSFDEWNVWYKNMEMNGDWATAPALLEEVYNWEDALICSQYLNSFIRNADVVRVACLAQAVNVIAPVLTRDEGILVQSIALPLSLYSRLGRGLSLQPVVLCDSSPGREFASVPHIDVSAVAHAGEATVFLTHRSSEGTVEVVVDLRPVSLSGAKARGAWHEAACANSWEEPEQIQLRSLSVELVDAHRVRLTLPPLALVAVQLTF